MLTAVTMPIGIMGAGLVLGWLWVRTGSIWMVALAHGALNNWGQFAFKFMSRTGQASDAVVLGAGGLALLTTGVFCSCTAAYPHRHSRRQRETILWFGWMAHSTIQMLLAAFASDAATSGPATLISGSSICTGGSRSARDPE